MKKYLSKLLLSVLAFSVVACMLCVSAGAATFDAKWSKATANFKPGNFVAKKADKGAITVDASETPESAYGSSFSVKKFSDAELECVMEGATATVRTAFDDSKIYVWIKVNDETKHSSKDGEYSYDSVELYLDFNNNKTPFNKVQSENSYAAQYRIQRGKDTDSMKTTVYKTEQMRQIADSTDVKTKEISNGYIVEVAIDHMGLPKSDTIGFTVQINDNQDGSTRGSCCYVTDGVQYFAYQYTNLLDNLELSGYKPTSSSASRKVVNDIAESAKALGEDKPSQAPVASKVTSTAPASSAAVSSVAEVSQAPVNDTSAIESTATEVESKSTVASESEKADTATDAEAESNGGLSVGALIGIIAAAVVVLGGAAVAVIVILKKKKKA